MLGVQLTKCSKLYTVKPFGEIGGVLPLQEKGRLYVMGLGECKEDSVWAHSTREHMADATPFRGIEEWDNMGMNLRGGQRYCATSGAMTIMKKHDVGEYEKWLDTLPKEEQEVERAIKIHENLNKWGSVAPCTCDIVTNGKNETTLHVYDFAMVTPACVVLLNGELMQPTHHPSDCRRLRSGDVVSIQPYFGPNCSMLHNTPVSHIATLKRHAIEFKMVQMPNKRPRELAPVDCSVSMLMSETASNPPFVVTAKTADEARSKISQHIGQQAHTISVLTMCDDETASRPLMPHEALSCIADTGKLNLLVICGVNTPYFWTPKSVIDKWYCEPTWISKDATQPKPCAVIALQQAERIYEDYNIINGTSGIGNRHHLATGHHGFSVCLGAELNDTHETRYVENTTLVVQFSWQSETNYHTVVQLCVRGGLPESGITAQCPPFARMHMAIDQLGTFVRTKDGGLSYGVAGQEIVNIKPGAPLLEGGMSSYALPADVTFQSMAGIIAYRRHHKGDFSSVATRQDLTPYVGGDPDITYIRSMPKISDNAYVSFITRGSMNGLTLSVQEPQPLTPAPSYATDPRIAYIHLKNVLPEDKKQSLRILDWVTFDRDSLTVINIRSARDGDEPHVIAQAMVTAEQFNVGDKIVGINDHYLPRDGTGQVTAYGTKNAYHYMQFFLVFKVAVLQAKPTSTVLRCSRKHCFVPQPTATMRGTLRTIANALNYIDEM